MKQSSQTARKEAAKPVTMQPFVSATPACIQLACNARNITVACSVLTVLLLLAHLGAYYLAFHFPNLQIAGNLVARFGLDRDGNVPTLFSAALLFGAAFLLYLAHLRARAAREPYHRHWLVLCFVFLFLGLDEATQIHEFLSLVVKTFSGKEERPDFLRHAWIIPYMLLVAAVVLYFFRFVLQLPPRTRKLFFVSAFLYVGSAMGMEMLEGMEETRQGKNTLVLLGMQTFEETMEMVAIILFNHTLIGYLHRQKVSLTLEPPSAGAPGCGG